MEKDGVATATAQNMNNGVRGLRRLAGSISRTLSGTKFEQRKQLHEVEEKKRFFLRKVRWQIALLANVGFMIAFGIRSNFGVAKSRMTTNFTDAYGYVHEKEFSWTASELGLMESSFFYGYAVSQIPAGMLAAKFAPNRLLGLGVAFAGLLNIATAITLKFHPFTDFAVMICQALQGVALGVTYPAMHGVWRHWAPPMDRSRLATTTLTGAYFGVMVGLPLTTYLILHYSWSTPFYFFGVLGVVWAIVWLWVSARTPAEHSFISESERAFIIDRVGQVTLSNMTLSTIPWGTILKSPAVWAIIVCNFSRSWTFFLLMSNQVQYMKDVLGIDMQKAGGLSIIPQILLILTVLSSGQMADYLRSTGRMTTGQARKLFNTIGFGGEALFLCLLAFVSSPTLAILCLVAGAGCGGISVAGFNVNHFDIAPRYAPILMGFSNGIGALAGVGSMITNNLTHDNPAGWKWVFLLAMVVDLIGIAFFLIFAKGEVQDWAKEQEPEITTKEIVHRISTIVRRMSTRLSMRSQSQAKDTKEEVTFGMSMDTGLAALRSRVSGARGATQPLSGTTPHGSTPQKGLRGLHGVNNQGFSATIGALGGISEAPESIRYKDSHDFYNRIFI
ncbi:unnamed protein product, partial [Mesorhabditis belari]|uniref:Major facilitator superfamily (MFS) profile domain-containing protein n=1 Tax=Mesorhabditis belari TaxID=2138241 RepID=A0AAF3E7X9_9BILA